MSVQLSPPNVYGNLGKFRKETDVNIFSGVIYENYPKPQKEEKLKTDGSPREPEINVPSGKEAKSSSSRLMLLGLGILCLLLVASIIIISWISVELVKKEEKVKNWENQTKHLTLENIMLENVTEETIRRNDELNRMREAILAFENFPVKDFCPEKSEHL
ncbi:uncharacterized protein LOC105939771 [Fundulus heteroclitus]|uniref:uncharacterized protein LOC105939771 n=1 Tax=Fundulus heteroclitus TaxID=8078 RepID=UPI00165BC985|nr:uncharacterized protein LOC105939771 [Fundulus heteroclitus]